MSSQPATAQIQEGLERYSTLTQDSEMMSLGLQLFNQTASAIAPSLTSFNRCEYAIPTVILGRSERVPCLVLLLDDKLVAGWKKGVIRKTVAHEVIEYTAVTDVWFGHGEKDPPTAPRRLSVEAPGRDLSFALPQKDYREVGRVLRDYVKQRATG